MAVLGAGAYQAFGCYEGVPTGMGLDQRADLATGNRRNLSVQGKHDVFAFLSMG
jgi:hypothetical protein